MINSKFLEASTLSQRELLFTPNNSDVVNPHSLPFVILYHRNNKGMEILDRNWHLILPNKPFLSYKKNPNIEYHLVHTRFNTQERGNPTQTGTTRGNNPQGGTVLTLPSKKPGKPQSRSQHTRIHNPAQINRRRTLHSTSLIHQDPTYITQHRTYNPSQKY